jgi:4-diphosphocytidyl-2-C-methyl-D-erythritol kinase
LTSLACGSLRASLAGSSVALFAPGKVNFGLRVLGRRADGYHLLESLFLPIDLGDDVRLALRDEPGVALCLGGDCAGVPADASNLAVRAAEAFLGAAGCAGGVAIELEKRVPSPGGLGGGSSDAAAVLRGLAALLPGRVPPERLRALALGLGADVPFFLDPRPALVGGIGEQIEPVPGLPSFTLLLAHPGVPLSTHAVYAQYDASAASCTPPGASLTPPGPGPSIRGLLALRERALALQRLVVNDLEPPATRLCPVVAELRKEIEATGASAVSLSGSGPTLFGVFANEGAADEARRRIGRRAGLRTWVVETAPSDAAAPGPRPAGA